MHRHSLDVDPIVEVSRPTTDHVTTTNNLFDVLINLPIGMIYELILRKTRARDNDKLGIPNSEPPLVLDIQRIAIEYTEEKVHGTVSSAEIINDSSLLTIVPIEPTKAIARDPDTPSGILESKLGLPTSGRPSIPDHIRLKLNGRTTTLLQQSFKALMILDENYWEFVSQVSHVLAFGSSTNKIIAFTRSRIQATNGTIFIKVTILFAIFTSLEHSSFARFPVTKSRTLKTFARSEIVARSKLYETLKVRRNLSSVSNTFKMFFTITAISTFASSNRIVKAGYISNCRVIACKAPVSRLRPAPNNKRANRRNRKRASRQWRGSEHRFR